MALLRARLATAEQQARQDRQQMAALRTELTTANDQASGAYEQQLARLRSQLAFKGEEVRERERSREVSYRGPTHVPRVP